MAYKIAEYLTDEAKRAAVAATYAVDDDTDPRLLTTDNQCPLGVALQAMGLPTPAGLSWDRWSSPSADEVAGALGIAEAEAAAEEFIDDWDDLAIEDLAAALGVTQ